METKRDAKQLRLADLIDISVLQQIQNWFSATTGIPAVIRDADGEMITQPSGSGRFCKLIAQTLKGRALCRQSHVEAVQRMRDSNKPTKYTCHTGLTQFAAPIRVKKHYFGSIVVGDRPQAPFTDAELAEIAERCDTDLDGLRAAGRELALWSDDDMRAAIGFLHNIANTLATLCYQGYQLQGSLNELTTLYEVTQRLTGQFDLQEVLDLIVRAVTEALEVKGCSLRLLDEAGEELVIKAVHNLSEQYLKKGPVLLSQSQLDQAAIQGEVVYIPDIPSDPRVLYPQEAREEGLCSGLTIGLMLNKQLIGTIHVYTSLPHEFTEQEVKLFRMLANQAAIAIESAKLHEERLANEKLARDLALAGEIQVRLLPREMPQIEGFDIVAKSYPSRQVGGDFFDFIPLPEDHLGIVIGDVAGKSVAGAILMAATRMALRAQVATTYAAHDIVSEVNRVLCRDTRAMEFVTMFYGAIDTRSRRLTYCNGGHGGPILIRGDDVQFLETGGTIVGSIEWATYEEETIELARGDTLFLYTDGIVEALSTTDELFGVSRLIDTIRPVVHAPAEDIAHTVRQTVRRFSIGVPQSDDIAMMVVKVV